MVREQIGRGYRCGKASDIYVQLEAMLGFIGRSRRVKRHG